MAHPLIIASTFILVYYVVVKFLKLTDPPGKPFLKYVDSKFNKSVLQVCDILQKPYIPTYLWGRCGHVQTVLYAKYGRFHCPNPQGNRRSVVMSDGATQTFDVFEPHKPHASGGDITLCICPGIANSSEKKYIKTFVDYSQHQGFRVAVLNHIGALESVPITSPRIFTYGDTEEYDVMIQYIRENHPDSTLISIGFSMGANIVVKYLGEAPHRQSYFLCALSVCQGYDCTRALDVLHEWESGRRIYNFMMTLNMLKHIRRNLSMLVGEGAKQFWQKKGLEPIQYNVDKILGATSLCHIDEHLSRRMVGSPDIMEFYEDCSSVHHLRKVEIPILLLHSEDDFLVPPKYNNCPLEYVEKAPNAIFAQTKHGGHLGFFEGGVVRPNTYTWLEKVAIGYVEAVYEVAVTQKIHPVIRDKLETNGNHCQIERS
ncbi:monoacylglycerol lipase ABHD2-like [Apostichopus japonicus]|uniref:monoacylglycerol lipase ABHD2-like n=1 Tax=Stichopus japonicus TaxID=307972 RepID=UPI003AB3C5A9